MPTLVLSRRYSEDSNTMWRAALDLGWDVERLQTYDTPEGLLERDPVLYGETLLADAVAEAVGLTLLEPDHAWLPSLPTQFLKRQVHLTSLGRTRTIRERTFVKPVDEKIFPARVYETGEVIDPTKAFSDDSAVLVSEPVSFGLEVRAFIHERRVATLSAYMRRGDIAKNSNGEWLMSPDEAAGANELLDHLLGDESVAMPPAVVIDVGLTDLGWIVVEANACWASGICGCDPREALRTIRRANVPSTDLREGDERWSRAAHIFSPR